MNEPPRQVVVALLLLTFVTGIVDAVSVLGYHVFTANMTGNIVFFGFALAGSVASTVSSSLVALVSFMAGAVIGGRVANANEPRGRWLVVGFGAEVTMLTAATVVAFHGGRAPVLVSLLALAMGLRNAITRKLAIPDLITTVLTSTVTGLAAESSLAGGSNPRWRRRVAAIAAMLSGACSGAVLLSFGTGPAVGAATLIEALALVLLARGRGSFA